MMHPMNLIPHCNRPKCCAAAGAFLLVCLAATLVPFSAARAEEQTGEQIYRQQCAMCHGANGEGNEDQYGSPLIGDGRCVS